MMRKSDPSSLNVERLVGALSEDLSRLAPELEFGPARAEEASEGPVDFSTLQTTKFLRDLPDRFRAVRDRIRNQHEMMVETRMERDVQHIRNTVERLERREEVRREEITAPSEGKFVVAGRVLDAETGEALPGVRVQGMERDPDEDDVLGEVRTDREGFYRLEYTEESFHAAQDKEPETYIRVLDEEGNALFTSDQSYRHKAERVETINAAIDGSKVPESRKLGKQLREHTATEVSTLRRRMQQLENHRKLRIDPLSMLPSEDLERPEASEEGSME